MNDLVRLSMDFERELLLMNTLNAKEILNHALDIVSYEAALNRIIVPTLQRIGSGMDSGNYSLSQIYMSGKICEKLVEDILPKPPLEFCQSPKIAIGVLADHHQLGKRIIYSTLRAAGYDLMDFGSGLKVEELINKTIDNQIQFLLISVLMFPSALQVKEVKSGLKGHNVKVIVGGAPFLFDRSLNTKIEADAVGYNGTDAIQILNSFIKEF